MSIAYLPDPAGSSDSRESARQGSRREPTAAGCYDELAAIASDPGMRRHACRALVNTSRRTCTEIARQSTLAKDAWQRRADLQHASGDTAAAHSLTRQVLAASLAGHCTRPGR
jgi:hypothetical protein